MNSLIRFRHPSAHPESFTRLSLLHLQEAGSSTAIRPHTSRREKLPSYLCFVVVDGSGRLVYEEKEYELSVGDVVFIDCRKAYSHSTDCNLWSFQWCHFYGASMPAVYEKYRERGGKPVFHSEDMERYTDILTELYALASSSDYIRDMRINEKLSVLLTLLTERISLKDLAQKFFINKYYLTRIFKEAYGITINSYVLSRRITAAKRQLRFSEMTIDEIAAAVGMCDASYFSRAFRKVEGVSPTEYRKQW